MKKTLETTDTPGRARMISKAGRIVSRRRVRRAGHHAVGGAGVHHHRAEVARIADGVEGELLGHPLVLAQLVVALGVLAAQR